MPLRFIRGFDRLIEQSRKLLVRVRAGSFGDRVLDAVGRSRELRLEARVARPWKFPGALVQRDRERVRALPGLDAFEVSHAAMVSPLSAEPRINSARR